MSKTPVLTDVQTLRTRVRQHVDDGAVTAGYPGENDPTTRRMMEGILAVEEEHADDLAELLVAFPDEHEGKGRETKQA